MKTMTCKECKGLEHLNCSACGNTGAAPSVAGMDGQIAAVVMRFIDRMSDVCQEDPAERILEQFVEAVSPLMLSAAPVPPVQGVPVCCAPSAEELELLRNGDYTPEELWGGSRPTCPKCVSTTPQPPAQVDGREALPWFDGEPPHPWKEEWFIAETIHGDRVVLRALHEDHSYDYKTADETYLLAKNIKRWCQFPDSEYVKLRHSPIELPGRKTADDYPGYTENFRGEAAALFNAGADEVARLNPALAQASPAPSADGGKVESDEVRRLREALERARYAIDRGEYATGCCCCGSSVASHGMGDGHSPVDEGDYFKLNVLKDIDSALSAQQGEGERG